MAVAGRESKALERSAHGALLSRNDYPIREALNATFFILGSGASVNDLTPAKWAQISCGVSVGLNSWAFHPFLPDAFALENPRDTVFANQAAAISRGLARAKLGTDPRKIWFFRDGAATSDMPKIALPVTLARHQRIYGRVQFPAVKRDKLTSLLEKYLLFDSLGKLAPHLLLDNGSTVVRMVNLALRAGFKEIVLVGVDLGDRGYFFEEDPQISESLGIIAPEMETVAGEHGTLSRSNRTAGFVEFIRSFADAAERVHNAKLYASSSSRQWEGVIDFFRWDPSGPGLLATSPSPLIQNP